MGWKTVTRRPTQPRHAREREPSRAVELPLYGNASCTAPAATDRLDGLVEAGLIASRSMACEYAKPKTINQDGQDIIALHMHPSPAVTVDFKEFRIQLLREPHLARGGR